jgi:hypothetical protein
VKPEFHDEFVELSALFFAGELSDEDWALLQVHLAYCESCHERFLEFQKVSKVAVPAMAAVLAGEHAGLVEESPEVFAQAHDRLMRELESLPAQSAPQTKRRFRWTSPLLLITAACIVVIGCFFAAHYEFKKRSAPMAQAPHEGNPQLRQIAPSSAREADLEEALKRAQDENTNLKGELVSAQDRLKQSNSSVTEIQSKLESEEASLGRVSQDRDNLRAQLAAAKVEVASLHNQFAESSPAGKRDSAQLTALETRVQELNSSLEDKDTELNEKSQMLDLDKDLLAHDRDIRDVIGARNLYIADISDLNASGKTAKQFGRIFYTKDRSLIFYGFDLDTQSSHKSEVSFQAWGSGSNTSAPVSLGLFYLDDQHKRWVLRCNDPKTLARLDMVFVTVEPPGGSSKPTGKQLLRAYLQIQPNHP